MKRIILSLLAVATLASAGQTTTELQKPSDFEATAVGLLAGIPVAVIGTAFAKTAMETENPIAAFSTIAVGYGLLSVWADVTYKLNTKYQDKSALFWLGLVASSLGLGLYLAPSAQASQS